MSDAFHPLRQQLQRLQERHERGEIDAEAHAAARGALERALIEQVMTAEPPAAPRASRRLGFGLAAGVFVLAAAGYAITGSPGRAGFDRPVDAPSASVAGEAGGPPVTDEQVADIVDKLAQRLQDKPDDATGWALLARAYAAMGRHAEAAPAFRKALALNAADVDLMADAADSSAARNGGRLDAEAMALIARVQAISPDHVKAAALSGSAAFDRRDYATAVGEWEKAARALPAGSPLLQQLQTSIAQARDLGGLPAAGLPTKPAMPTMPSAARPGAAAAASSVASSAVDATAISGKVSLTPALASRLGPNDTLFIVARATSGSRMPLAVLRSPAARLPLAFTLDDSMAVAPGATISGQAQVIVSARISRSGDALPQPGDLSGQVGPVAPGTRAVELQIDAVVGP